MKRDAEAFDTCHNRLDSRPGMPTVAHVNYSFFHSTHSYIYFNIRGLTRVESICLTRAPRSASEPGRIPSDLAGDYYLYTGRHESALQAMLRSSGASMRHHLADLPEHVARPVLKLIKGQIEPRMRHDTDSATFLNWTEAILRRRGVRLIHAYFGAVGWRMLILKRHLGIPLVVSFLGGDDVAPSLPEWWWWLIQNGKGKPDWPARMRELFAEGDLFLAEGPAMRARLVELGCPPRKIQLQRIGIPVKDIPFRRRAACGAHNPTILFAGRLCEQKGVLYALEAIRQLRAEGRKFDFRIIGDGRLTTDGGVYATQVRGYVRRHRLQACVQLLGFMEHDRYLGELNAADLFLHPSIVDDAGRGEGGAPTTILDAQASGMPVVATEHCDIPYVTRPGVSASLVPERDSAALARALRKLLDHPSSWEPMGRAGRRHVEEFHDIEREVLSLQDGYRSLLARGEC